MPTDNDPAPLAGVIGEVMQKRGIDPRRAAAAEEAARAATATVDAARKLLNEQLDRMSEADLPDEPDPDDPTLPTKAEFAALKEAIRTGGPLPKGFQVAAAELAAAQDSRTLPAGATDTDKMNHLNLIRATYEQAQASQRRRVEEINRLSLELGLPPVKVGPVCWCLFCGGVATHLEVVPDGPPLSGANPAPAVEGVERTRAAELPLCETHAKRRAMLDPRWSLREYPSLPIAFSKIGAARPLAPAAPPPKPDPEVPF